MEAARQGENVALSEAEFQFHDALCELSGNHFLLSLYRSLAAQIRMSIGRDAEMTNLPLAIAPSHVPLVEAIEAGDEHLAARLLEHHMNDTVLDYLRRTEARVLYERVLAPAASDLPQDVIRVAGGLGTEPAA